jgi:hypothetical protein
MGIFARTIFRTLSLISISVLIVPCRAAEFQAGGLIGYKGGLSFRATLTISEFAQNFPLAMEAGIGYTSFDPGIALDARRVFINDATNGTPEKTGSQWDLRLDFLYRVHVLGIERAYLYGGVRYSIFTANFDFVGGNENFDVTSNQVGLGVGLKSLFPMGNRFDFVISAGLEYYLPAVLSGHDTEYAPDNDNVNPRQGYSYADADAAINQPKLQPVILLGISYRL